MLAGLVAFVVPAAAANTTEPMLAAGELHSLALKSDDTVWAWGWNELGQLGDGTDTNRSTPVQVSSLVLMDAEPDPTDTTPTSSTPAGSSSPTAPSSTTDEGGSGSNALLIIVIIIVIIAAVGAGIYFIIKRKNS